MKNGRGLGLFTVCLFIAGMVICLALLSSCTTTRYVTVPEVHTEYVSKTDTFIKVENNYIHDSVLVRMKGDTCFVDRWHTQYRDRDVLKVVTDTVIKCDSIPAPYPVEVVKEPSFSDRVWQMCLSTLIAFLVLLLYCKIRKKR